MSRAAKCLVAAGVVALALACGGSTWGGRARAANDAPLPRVTVLATGGTIAGSASSRAEIGYDAGKVSAADLIAAVPGIDKLARITTEQVSSIGSQDMNDAVWFTLARRIDDLLGKGDADAVVITHGTDTMEETAFFLSNVLLTDKPVVLVGSMRPSTAISADGPANLYEAVKVAVSNGAKGRGVLVVLNDTIHLARFVQKTNTTSVQTFLSPNDGPAGFVDPASVRFVQPIQPRGTKPYALPAQSPLPRVEIVYAHAGMDAAAVEDAVKRGAKGIVLAGVGDGNASKDAIAALAKAAKQGIVVIRASRVGSGFVNRNVEVDDDKLGFAVALDLNPQKARVLAQLLIANGVTDPRAVQDAVAGGRYGGN
jgi:L-asparaginase